MEYFSSVCTKCQSISELCSEVESLWIYVLMPRIASCLFTCLQVQVLIKGISQSIFTLKDHTGSVVLNASPFFFFFHKKYLKLEHSNILITLEKLIQSSFQWLSGMPYESFEQFLFNYILHPSDECMFTYTLLVFGIQISVYVGEDLYYPDKGSHVISTT